MVKRTCFVAGQYKQLQDCKAESIFESLMVFKWVQTSIVGIRSECEQKHKTEILNLSESYNLHHKFDWINCF